VPDLEAASGDGLTEVWESFAVAGRVWAFGRVAARFAGATFGRSKKNFAKRNSNFSFTVCVCIYHTNVGLLESTNVTFFPQICTHTGHLHAPSDHRC